MIKIPMKLIFKLLVSVIVLYTGAFYLYFFISPSVTIKNNSEYLITKAIVHLPNSRLNFAEIAQEQQNTIYYSLSQKDGSYEYVFSLDGKSMSGSCGYITNNELNKRVVITVNNITSVVCK